MTKALEPLPVPSRREMTLAMVTLLVVGGFAVTRGGNSNLENGFIHVANEGDDATQVVRPSRGNEPVDQSQNEMGLASTTIAGVVGSRD